ncbi:MAG: N-acetylmuramoyl-L-alanine amidase [Actinomycetota bacterium]|nr:N-acetylmuramoyl-L-alanine amidase [Actinomycetota bacterium]
MRPSLAKRRLTVAGTLAALAAAILLVVLVATSGKARDASRARPSRPGPSLSVSASGGVPLDRSRFASGACVAFAPSAGDNHHTVFIDAGHGGVDPGGKGVTQTGRVIYEAPENLEIELETMNLLRAHGFRVVVSRTTNTDVLKPTPADLTGGVLSVEGAKADVAARDVCANLARATILVGIYMDTGPSPTNAGSLTAYDPDRSFAAESKRLATLLQRDVLARMNAHGWHIPNDGVQPDTTLGAAPLTTTAAAYHHLLLLGPAYPGWFTTPSDMPGALIEPLFISDPFEGSIANSAAGHAAIAEGVAQAVEQYFDSSSS